MAQRTRRFGLVAVLLILTVLTVMVASYLETGTTYAVTDHNSPFPESAPSDTPSSVASAANLVADGLFGRSSEKHRAFTNQLLNIYGRAKDTDVVIIFNRGGWGNKSLGTSEGWWTILDGIQSELTDMNCTSLLLQHVRTDSSLRGHLNELWQRTFGYTSKSRSLAGMVEFITDQLPGVRVILAGESYGTIICSSTMRLLKNHTQVYCIQTGPPFWLRNTVPERTLVMRDNGITPDSYSQGNIPAVLWGDLMYGLGFSSPVDDFGTPPHHIGAPGHDYWWQYPEVASAISDFLESNFGLQY